MSLEVLYEDNHLIAVNKRPGDIVQGDRTGDKPLAELVMDHIREKYNKPGNVFTGVIHRLDRPSSGVVVFARTSKGLARMNEVFQKRAITKTYLAVVGKRPDKDHDKLVHYLRKNQKNNKATAFPKEAEGAKKAITEYTVVGSSDNYHLLRIDIETGRHHQIRCQLAAIGSPIKGDLKYGAPQSNKDGSIHLHALSVEFVHPIKNEPVKIVARPPDDTIWNYFMDNFEISKP